MKKVFVAFLTALLMILTACGNRESQEPTNTAQSTNETIINEDEASTDTETTDDLSTEQTEGIPKADYADDWKAAYYDFMKTWQKDNEEMTFTTAAEYSFVSMQGIKYPVLVLFDGWRSCSFYVYENGKVSAIQDQNKEDLLVLVHMPVYFWNDSLYFFGASGAPAIYVTNEVSVTNNSLVSETIASAIYVSSLGDKDYFHGRNDVEITEDEYNAIVEDIKANAEEVEFNSMEELKG